MAVRENRSVFNNGRIAVSDDIVFGPSVWTEGGWYPIRHLDDEEVKMCRDLLDWAPLCPKSILDAMYGTESRR